MCKSIAVIGSEGYVGKATVRMFEKYYTVVKYDPVLKDLCASKEEINECDLSIVCVPTPMDMNSGFPYKCDVSIVEEVVEWLDTPVIMIKSTVAPSTTDKLKDKTGKRIVMSPEYIGEGKYYMPSHKDFSKNMEDTPFWIVGGDDKDVKYVYDILVPILGPLKNYITVKAVEAELIKYWENTTLAMRVVLANEMKKSCDIFNANYYRVREGWVLDPRVEFFHSIAFAGKPGFDKKCLPKDVNALARVVRDKGDKLDLVEGVLEANRNMRKKAGLKD